LTMAPVRPERPVKPVMYLVIPPAGIAGVVLSLANRVLPTTANKQVTSAFACSHWPICRAAV